MGEVALEILTALESFDSPETGIASPKELGL